MVILTLIGSNILFFTNIFMINYIILTNIHVSKEWSILYFKRWDEFILL